MLHQSRKNRIAGFTLIELIIVVIVLAIISLVAVPYASSGADIKVLAAARTLASDIQYAQDLAITSQVPISVFFNISSNSYYLFNTSTSQTVNNPISKSAYTVDFSSKHGVSGVDIVSADFSGATRITFDCYGSPENAGSVVLGYDWASYTISVSAVTGKVTVTAGGS
jgi:prepilin-type N-terminal cleavage/methylation domain-containing protein